MEIRNEGRIAYIDIVRGIGISLVVLGHNQICQHGTLVYSVIFSFHMPLFFFLSGYFHKNSATISDEIAIRGKKLLLPFYFTAFLYIALKAISNPLYFIQMEFKPVLFGIIWGSGGRGSLGRYLFWPPLWFLTALFLTQVIFCISSRVKILNKYALLRFLFYSILLVAGIHYMEIGGSGYIKIFGSTLILSENGLPLNLDIVPITIFFYWIGAEFRVIKHSFSTVGEKLKDNMAGCYVVFTFLMLHLYLYIFDHESYMSSVMDLNLRNYGHAFWATVLAILGILSVLYIGLLLEKMAIKMPSRIFIFIGQYSLPILILHHFFQKSCAQLIPSHNLWFLSMTVGIFAPIILSMVFISRSTYLSAIYGISPR